MNISVHCLVLVFVFIVTGVNHVTCQTGDDLRALHTDIFALYNKDVRPSLDQTQTTTVLFDIYLLGINSINVAEQKMTTTAYVNLLWDDNFLVWDSNLYGGIFDVDVPQGKVWKPDIALQNGFSKLAEFGSDFIQVNVISLGSVFWKTLDVFETKCTVDVTYFPFDKQSCSLEFGAWMTSYEKLELQLGDKGFILDDYQKSDEWELMSTSATTVQTATLGTRVVFTINVKRIPNYYVTNILVPVFLLTLLLILTFLIPADSGEKLGYAMTVFLSFAVFLTIVGASFPVTSSTSIMTTFLMILISLGTLIVAITALQLRLHHRSSDRQVPKTLKKFVHICQLLQCRKSCKRPKQTGSVEPSTEEVKQYDETRLEKEENDEETSWSDVTSAIDFVCFFGFLIIVFIVTVTMMAIAANQS